MVKKEWRFDTLTVHGSEGIDKVTGALSPPIYQSSTFSFKDADTGAAIFKGECKGYVYSRLGNPTQHCLEKEMAFLEGGEAALAFSSGMAAESAIMLTLCRPGDNYVCSSTVYGGTHALNIGFLKRMNIEAREVDTTNVENIVNAIDEKTKLIFIETPANPTLCITDIALCAEIAKKHNIVLAVDNTFATPVLQRPIELGADIVMHSATKYIGGHGDTIAGVLVGGCELISQIHKETLVEIGPCINPFSAWLLLRGLKTLSVRVRTHCNNARHVAQYLCFHPKVDKVYYPGFRFHHGHDIARRQMTDFGGMISFELKADREQTKKVINALELCTQAVSLGDCDTLVCHPASTTHSSYTVEQLKDAGIPESLIRLSVGIEDPRDICDDLGQALKQIC